MNEKKLNMEKLLFPPDESLAKSIKMKLNEVDDQKLEHNIELFEKWIQCQPHLPKNYDKHMLQTYIRGTKHNLEVAQRKFEMYFVARNKMRNLYTYHPYTEEEKAIVENCAIFEMPHLTQDGYRVIVIKVLDPNPDLFDIRLFINNIWKFAHLRMCNEHLMGGDAIIVDFENISASVIPKLLIPEFKQVLHLTQEGMSFPLKQMHFVNAPSYMEKVVMVVKMVMKEKIRKRIHVDQGTSLLKEYIHKKSLPKDYGGDGESIEVIFARRMKHMDDIKEWFVADNEIKSTGPVPKHLISTLGDDNDLGVQGSFRKLVID